LYNRAVLTGLLFADVPPEDEVVENPASVLEDL
jgi:hypothetical protein